MQQILSPVSSNISLHVGNIYQDQELSEEGTRKKFFLVRQEGKRQVKREIDHYNLDMNIALGYSAQGDCPPVHLILLVILDKEVKNSPRLLVE